MGVRVGNAEQRDAGPAPAVAPGGTVRGAIAEIVRERGVDAGHDWFDALDDGQLLDMSQYNLFPNVTVLVFADMLQVVRARPGATPDDAYMDAFSFDRVAPDDPRPRVEAVRHRARARPGAPDRPRSSIRTSRTSRAASAACTSPGSPS